MGMSCEQFVILRLLTVYSDKKTRKKKKKTDRKRIMLIYWFGTDQKAFNLDAYYVALFIRPFIISYDDDSTILVKERKSLVRFLSQKFSSSCWSELMDPTWSRHKEQFNPRKGEVEISEHVAPLGLANVRHCDASVASRLREKCLETKGKGKGTRMP